MCCQRILERFFKRTVLDFYYNGEKYLTWTTREEKRFDSVLGSQARAPEIFSYVTSWYVADSGGSNKYVLYTEPGAAREGRLGTHESSQ